MREDLLPSRAGCLASRGKGATFFVQ